MPDPDVPDSFVASYKPLLDSVGAHLLQGARDRLIQGDHAAGVELVRAFIDLRTHLVMNPVRVPHTAADRDDPGR